MSDLLAITGATVVDVRMESEPMQRLVRLIADSRAFFDPTLLVDSALSLDGYAIDADNPANADLPEDVRDAFVREETPDVFDVSKVSKDSARDGFRKRQRLVGMLHEAGVRLLAGTDCFGLGKHLPGLGLQNELALLVESGLSPLADIQNARRVRTVVKGGRVYDAAMLRAQGRST